MVDIHQSDGVQEATGSVAERRSVVMHSRSHVEIDCNVDMNDVMIANVYFLE